MPFVSIHTARKLSKINKENIKHDLGQKITLIPGKKEEVLMIEFIDEVSLYFAGVENPNATYIDVKCYKAASFEENQNFTEAVNEIMIDEIGISNLDIYLTISEFSTWGTKGTLK